MDLPRDRLGVGCRDRGDRPLRPLEREVVQEEYR